MNDAQLHTLDQLRAFLDGTATVGFSVGANERYDFISAVAATAMEHKNDAQSGGSRKHFAPAGRRFGCGRAGLIFLSFSFVEKATRG